MDKSEPATHAFIQVVNTPAKNARNTVSARSCFRFGAIALRPPNWIPIDPGLAKPHSAVINKDGLNSLILKVTIQDSYYLYSTE